ncbi:MAG: Kelch repeat-containing protein [Actinomycetota bacterium]
MDLLRLWRLMRTRREFLRMAGLAALGGLAACRRPAEDTVAPTTAATTPPRTPDQVPGALEWLRLRFDGSTPPPRRDHTITGREDAPAAFLFGGREQGRSLDDLWILDVDAGVWRMSRASGPAPRFGHNAVLFKGRLVVFGGEGGPGVFFNDVWAFDPEADQWDDISPDGAAPSPRYGASGTLIGETFTISHGFTDTGRFDDTWSLGRRWQDVSPDEGPRPIERCLHRASFVPAIERMVLFGGQTTGVSALDDTWLFDSQKRTWTEVGGRRPPARNLYAEGATNDAFFVFGGAGLDGPRNDIWAFRAGAWEELRVSGQPPPARGATAGTIIRGPNLLVFGGAGASGELDDAWELPLPKAPA